MLALSLQLVEGQHQRSNNMNTHKSSLHRKGILAAWIMIAGTLLSGPLGLVLVTAVHPKPPWQGAQTLAANYHPIQAFPFFAGFLLVLGSALLIATLYQLAGEEEKPAALLAVICTAAFVGLIFFNYICQTTFLPPLLTNYQPQYKAIVSTLAFANPYSLCWAIEMWGYALLGLATWLTAPVFSGSRIERTTAGLQVANGMLSIAGGFITAVNLGWVMTPAGIANYVIWNILMVAWGGFVIASFVQRERRQQATIAAAVTA
jgi:hypothetical protein